MKINNYKKYLAFVVSSLFFIPFFIFAGSSGSTINNPLGANNSDVSNILLGLMNIVAKVGAIVVVFFIIYSGFTLVMAQGKPDGLKKAKDMFIATLIGGAILLGADIIANVVVNTINSATGRTS